MPVICQVELAVSPIFIVLAFLKSAPACQDPVEASWLLPDPISQIGHIPAPVPVLAQVPEVSPVIVTDFLSQVLAELIV